MVNHCCGANLALSGGTATVGVPLDTVLAARYDPRKAPA
jgi:hypothetical protein